MIHSLHEFEKSAILDYAFKEQETSLGDQVVNELTITGLESLSIELKENEVRLSSVTPFSLNRTREKVIVNHRPQIDLVWPSFLECTIQPRPLYRDEEAVPTKVYHNEYRDEVYMQSVASSGYPVPRPLTHPEQQIQLVTAHHQQRVNDLVIDQLIDTDQMTEKMRRWMHMTLTQSCSGVIEPELMALFKQVKETLLSTHADVFRQTLAQDLACVKKWGSLGEMDMHARIHKDYTLFTQRNLCHAVKHTEWVLRGSGLSKLRFFNIKDDVRQVDFYNRSFASRSICYHGEHTLKPYERMSIERKPSQIQNVMKEFISYTCSGLICYRQIPL